MLFAVHFMVALKNQLVIYPDFIITIIRIRNLLHQIAGIHTMKRQMYRLIG